MWGDATDIPPGLLTGAVVVIRRSPAKSSGSGGSTNPPSCADLTTGLCASMPTRFAPDAGATLQMTRPTPRGAPDEAAGIGSAFFCNYPMNLSFEQLTKPAWTPARRSPIKPKEMQK
ncbi:hypothetical protein [Mesorhizobium sp. NZP2298]|uniref:hypothetical protein n=1 Tax=Mesorhizobium sp. NZP2298 TaxID=2483403 RepID=UPI001554A919|nr:hypothetical protein [Mesorhizobium sp. NZP2298]